MRPPAGAPPQAWLEYFQKRLQRQPRDRAALKGLAYAQAEQNNPAAAIEAYQKVLEIYPDDRDSLLELARLQAARRQYAAALAHYNALLKAHPRDPDALLGKARLTFYQGKFRQAQETAYQALIERPQDFSTLFLLASIAHARGRRGETLNFLDRAEKLKPGNSQVSALKSRVLAQPRVTLRTTAAYAREIGPPSEFGVANEDLRTYTYGAALGLGLFPKTRSIFSFTSLPTDSPPGPARDALGYQIPTGLTGAAAPYQFLYRQSTRFNSHFTLRAGLGFVHFGPGTPVSVPGAGAPIRSAKERPLGLAGLSLGLTKKLSFDLDAARSALTYTPVSSRLGVIEDRLLGRLNYFFTPRTEIHLAYWYGLYSVQEYARVDHDQANGGTISFNRNFIQSERFAFDAGYEGMIYGFAGPGRNVYLGFFNPSFYQLHEIVPRISGRLWGPWGYDLRGGIGVQQVGREGAVTRAWNVSPNLSLRVSKHLRLIFGYTHYNTAQVLGPLRGNEVRFSTEWEY